jgi:hypothetical protein
MSTFWSKMIIFAVIIVALVVAVKKFSGMKPAEQQKTIYEQFADDDKRLRAEPGAEKAKAAELPAGTEVAKPANIEQPAKAQETAKTEAQPAAASQTKPEAEVVEMPPIKAITEPLPEFKELEPEDEVRASQLFEMAMAERKRGRLPMMGFKNMVDYCREIIKNYPESEYAYKARRMLGDIPQRFRERYNITEAEIHPQKK